MDSNNSVDFAKDSSSPKGADEPSIPEIGKCIRDTDFYFYDGNCVLLAQNRLFRIHKSLLTREPSFFRELLSMYSLPEDDDMEVSKESTSVGRCAEGESDEYPIVCRDSAEEIRDLCWALYASPGEIIQQQSRETIDIPKIIRVLAIAHKYQFENLQSWAFNTIYNAFKDCPNEKVKLLSCCRTFDKVATLFKIVHLCNHASLAKDMEEEILCLIQSNTPLTTRLKYFSEILSVLDNVPLSLRVLRGKVYYTLLSSMEVFLREASQPRDYDTKMMVDDPASYLDTILQNPRIKTSQLGLLKGLWSLTQLGRRLFSPPEELNIPHCPQGAECTTIWKDWWSGCTSGMITIDPIEIIDELYTRMDCLELICETCFDNLGAKLEEIKVKVEASLPDHFGIP